MAATVAATMAATVAATVAATMAATVAATASWKRRWAVMRSKREKGNAESEVTRNADFAKRHCVWLKRQNSNEDQEGLNESDERKKIAHTEHRDGGVREGRGRASYRLVVLEPASAHRLVLAGVDHLERRQVHEHHAQLDAVLVALAQPALLSLRHAHKTRDAESRGGACRCASDARTRGRRGGGKLA
eukprot:2750940-Pleurochrysis_carterae.AAC.1